MCDVSDRVANKKNPVEISIRRLRTLFLMDMTYVWEWHAFMVENDHMQNDIELISHNMFPKFTQIGSNLSSNQFKYQMITHERIAKTLPLAGPCSVDGQPDLHKIWEPRS